MDRPKLCLELGESRDNTEGENVGIATMVWLTCPFIWGNLAISH